MRCDFITGESISLFQDNKAKRQLLVDAFRKDVEEADPEVLTGEPCASLTIEYSGVPSAESVDAMVPGRTGDYYFFACFYVFPQFKRTVEILKETGYPVSMEDVKLSAVEVEYYMNEEHNEYSSPVVYDQPEQLEELKKVLRCYRMVPFWEKREADKWVSLKIPSAILWHQIQNCLFPGIFCGTYISGRLVQKIVHKLCPCSNMLSVKFYHIRLRIYFQFRLFRFSPFT